MNDEIINVLFVYYSKSMKKGKKMLIFFLIFLWLTGLLVGVFLLYIAISVERKYLKKKERCTVKGEGVLVKFREDKTTVTHEDYISYITYYYPIYEYVVDDKKYEVESSLGESNRNIVLLGEKKEIFYNPNNCEESYISGENPNSCLNKIKILGIIFLVIVIVEILIALIIKI